MKQIGGVGHIIEIDESAVGKRKYNRGKKVNTATTWVLGMYDRETKEGVIVHVPKRDKLTMIPEIKKYVKWGSIIWTDQWKAYNGLDNEGYIHETVDYMSRYLKLNATDPERKSTTFILKALLTNKLAQNMNLEGGNDQISFRGLYLYKVLLGTLQSAFPKSDLTKAEDALGGWLKDAKWRRQRQVGPQVGAQCKCRIAV